MGEILGLGLTHSPSFIKPDEAKDSSLHRTLKNNPNVPEEMKNPSNWPEPMRIEFGEDEGLASAKRMRERMVVGFRTLRAELDAFNPDFVIVWGDDQYENFKEDIIPPFCVLAYDEITCKALYQPRRQRQGQRLERTCGQDIPVPRASPSGTGPGERPHQPGD